MERLYITLGSVLINYLQLDYRIVSQMNMNISLQPELEQYLQEQVKKGLYQSVDEAVGEGIRLLMNRDEIYQGRFEELKADVRIGIEASNQGQVVDRQQVFESLV